MFRTLQQLANVRNIRDIVGDATSSVNVRICVKQPRTVQKKERVKKIALKAGMRHRFVATNVDVHCDVLCKATRRVQVNRGRWHKSGMAVGNLRGDRENVHPTKR